MCLPHPRLPCRRVYAAEGFCFSALETIRDGVCVFDSSWRCCYANAALLSLTGFGADEILGKPLDALLDAAPVDYLAGTAVSDDRELTCKDDSLVSVSVSMSSVTCGCHLAVFHLDAVFFRLNRALRMWQACSKTIVNADNGSGCSMRSAN